MRIRELTLIAYGRFTDHALPFPKATNDFHVIIGPNEAGKSTVRRAIFELLFGIERQSPMGFIHPQSDLRLSGSLDSDSATLSFIRTKQQKSLRSLSDEPLPDTYLSAVLGTLNADIFAQLHCLDHDRLLRGGQDIVDPRTSVSQILFQTASGLESFAEIREALGQRASALFTQRGRNNEYSSASDRYTLAQKKLKEVQIRTKDWVEARDRLTQADSDLETERKDRRELETLRAQWERVRRLTPLIERLHRLELELFDLGECIAFPPSAKETLDSGISAMNETAAIVKTRAEDVEARQKQLDAITFDQKVLDRAGEIERMARLGGLYANHGRDLPLRRTEVENWLKEVLDRAKELNWGTTEEDVRLRLPQDKLLRDIDGLVKGRGALVADARSAKEAEDERRTSLEDLREQLEASTETTIDAQLVAALDQALPYKMSDGKQKNLQGAVRQAEAGLANAMAALGRSGLDVDSLRALQLPSPARVSALQTGRQDLKKASDVALTLVEQHGAEAADLELQVTQFVRSHKVVTQAEVSGARQERDQKWSAIKSGVDALTEAAPLLDAAIRLADELVDARTLSETDGATLQALRDRLEKAEGELQRHKGTVEANDRKLQEFDFEWDRQATAMGLPGMHLDDVPEWLAKCDAALQAAATVAEKKHDYEHEHGSACAVRDTLSAELSKANLVVAEGSGIAALCTVAELHIKQIERTNTQRQALLQQLQVAEAAMKVAQRTKASKDGAVEQWESKWKDALTKAHLAGLGENAAEVEAAVKAADFIRLRLERIDTHRSERIKTMEADLQQLQELADLLAQTLAPDLAQTTPADISRVLSARLEEAKQQFNRKTHAQEFRDAAERQLAEARSSLEQARRGLEPLLNVAGVDDPMLAIPFVEKSQKKADLQNSISTTRTELEKGSDGLTLEQVQAEVVSHPATDAPSQLMDLKDRLSESEQKITTQVQAQLTAKQAYDAIDGGAQAAIAEGEKQEALADMADASEEYIRISAAGSLLKWAVDRYRDRKQAPLLERASIIFKSLTLGSFEKLRIDFDQNPPALQAYRRNNQTVRISGLSDGTRDQLFLALRIAALELQAEQGTPVPFIADDLFINFDDKRAKAGLEALYALSKKTQVLFLSHQEHLLPVMQQMFPQANVITLNASEVAPL